MAKLQANYRLSNSIQRLSYRHHVQGMGFCTEGKETESGKPAEIIEKMVSGRLKKYLKEVTLLGQAFIKDPDQSIEKLLASKKAVTNSFVCYEVGEGIEKKVENFAEEVMAQAKASEGS